MAFDRQIKTAESIPTKRISTALKNDAIRTIELHHGGYDGFENQLVVIWKRMSRMLEFESELLTIVGDTLAQGNID